MGIPCKVFKLIFCVGLSELGLLSKLSILTCKQWHGLVLWEFLTAVWEIVVGKVMISRKPVVWSQ